MYSSQQKIQISQAMDNIFRSEGFSQASQLRNFLNFVVQKTLEDNAHEIKGYTIGVDALGRSEDFDPQTDPTVRVMAGRLRQALKNYYSDLDIEDLVQISVPKGTYVPTLKFSKPAPPSTEIFAIAGTDQITSLSTEPAVSFFNLRNITLIIMAAILLGLSTWYFDFFSALDQHTTVVENRVNTNEELRISIYINSNDDALPDWFSLAEAREGLVTAFSKFHEFQIFSSPDPASKSPHQKSDYHFSVLIARAGQSDNIRAFSKLIRQTDSTIIWSAVLSLPKPKSETGINAAEISGRVIAPLLSPYGVVYGDIANRKSIPDNIKCTNYFYNYFSSESVAKYQRARKCLEKLVADNKSSSSIHAMLTFLHIEIYRKQYKGYGDNPLTTANEQARQAILLNPENARAHQAQFAVHKIQGHKKEAIASATRAVALNSFDSDIIGDYAAYLVSIGEFERAKPMLEKAAFLTPSKPIWLVFFEFLNAEMTGNFKRADITIAHLDMDRSPLAALAVTLAASRNHNEIIADKALNSLLRQEPGFAIDPAAALLRRGFSPIIVEKIAATLAKVKISKYPG